MKYIKLFEEFDVNGFSNQVESTLIQLSEAGFEHALSVHDYLVTLTVSKKDGSDFIYDDIKDYLLTIIDYYYDTVGDIDVSYSFNTNEGSYSGLDNAISQTPALLKHTLEPEGNRLINLLDCYILTKKDEGAGDI